MTIKVIFRIIIGGLLILVGGCQKEVPIPLKKSQNIKQTQAVIDEIESMEREIEKMEEQQLEEIQDLEKLIELGEPEEFPEILPSEPLEEEILD